MMNETEPMLGGDIPLLPCIYNEDECEAHGVFCPCDDYEWGSSEEKGGKDAKSNQ